MSSNAALPRRLLVAVDYSELSRHALRRALQLAAAFGAELHILHAWEAPYAPTELSSADAHAARPNLIETLQQSARDAMRRFLSSEDLSAVAHQWYVVSGAPQTRLLEHAAQHRCDWVVLGTRGHRAVGRWFLGSVAQWVVRHAPCPVLVVTPRTTSPAAQPDAPATSESSQQPNS